VERALALPFDEDADARAVGVAMLDARRRLCQRRDLDRTAERSPSWRRCSRS
jgi:hypothetical protein